MKNKLLGLFIVLVGSCFLYPQETNAYMPIAQEIVKTQCVRVSDGQVVGTANDCTSGQSSCVDTTCA